MRVVVAAVSAPVHLHGVSRHAANLVRGLLTRSEVSEVHLLCGAWQQKGFEEAVSRQDPRLHIHGITIGSGTLSRNRWYYADLPRIATQLDADILHLAYPVPLTGKAFDCPVVLSLHDLYAFDIPGNFGFPKAFVNRVFMRRCIRAVDAIACVSESTRERLIHWMGRSVEAKAITVLNAVEPVSSICAQKPAGLRRAQSIVLCIAQHRRNKNIPVALKAFEGAMSQGILPPEAILAVVGVPGPQTEWIQKYTKRHRLERKVLLLSGISDRELQWCYRNCELLLAPSIIEGFGAPVVEALLAGCRVVCSDIPAFREVADASCRFVELGQGEVERFIEAIKDVMAAPRNVPSSMPWFSAERSAETFLILYRRLLTSPISPDLSLLRSRRAGHQGA